MGLNIDFGQILVRIWDAASIYLARPRSGVNNLDRATERLRAKLEDVNRTIDEAERNGQTATGEAQQWKSQAEEFVSKEAVAAIRRDYGAMQCLGGWSWNCISINRRVTEELEVVKELISAVDNVSRVAVRQPPPPVVELPVSNNVVGIESNVIQIVNQIRDENVSVIGIYGMGGIGKTTLLKLINNHKEISKLKFEYVVWIGASKGCKLQKLQMELAKKVGLNLEDDESEDDRANKLFNFLKEKNCLLLLDDIWQSYDLIMLGMKTPNHDMKQKRKVVVFTTRNKHVCTQMGADVKKKVKGLSSEQAWELFQKYAGDVINSQFGINRLAKEITNECAGLPRALINVGQAMSGKMSWEAWNDALAQLKQSRMPEVTGKKEGDSMFVGFKLSYDSLEDDNMRARLLCCSLWPEDFKIDKIVLIQCWLGLGLIDEFDSINQAFDRGHSLIDTLSCACLLERVDGKHATSIKMHDVIRDMALWMASDCGSNRHKWIVKTCAKLNQLKLQNEQCKVVQRASFMHNGLTDLPCQTPTFPKLSVFMLQENPKLVLIPGSFFQSLPILTFLDLSGTNITELPREINMLAELQHLNLNFTPVKKLPAELSSLAKLKYLLLVGTERLARVPKGTISNLSLLKLLDLYQSKYANLNELGRFEGCQKYIGITLRSMTNLERLGSLPQLSIWKLQLKNMRDFDPRQLFESIMNGHNTRQGLERLEIVDVRTGGELTVARSNKDHEGGLECLRYMALKLVHDLQKITWNAIEPQMVFPNLHELNIFECKMLRNITWVLQLPNLSILRVSNCDEMEELISCVESSANSCVGLCLLSLARLPKLNCISRQPLTFPYLKEIFVSSCPELRKLPFGAEICQNRLKGIFGQTEWWENIECEDDNEKNLLFPYFKTKLQKFALQLYMKDAEKSARAEVLRTAVEIPGVVSVSVDSDRHHLTVVGDDGIDSAALVRRLQKKIGSVHLMTTSRFTEKTEEMQELISQEDDISVVTPPLPQPSVELSQDPALMQISHTKLRQKFELRLEMTDAKSIDRALQTASSIPGVVSVSVDSDRPYLTVVGDDGIDSAALVRRLQKKIGSVHLMTTSRFTEKPEEIQELISQGDDISVVTPSLPQPSVELSQDPALIQISRTKLRQKFELRLEMTDAKSIDRALQTASSIPGVVSVSVDSDRPHLIVVGDDGIDSAALVRRLQKKIGSVHLMTTSRFTEMPEEIQELISQGDDISVVTPPLPQPSVELSQDPALMQISRTKLRKKFELRLEMIDDRSRARALRIVTSISGVESVSLDHDRLIVIGEQLHPMLLVRKLRKEFGTVELLSVGAKESIFRWPLKLGLVQMAVKAELGLVQMVKDLGENLRGRWIDTRQSSSLLHYNL